ncbi:hypothetical protein BU23DRAFT_555323 [Bimuria novae-zelandiae CBS 107.79]|uniref:Uncharacterized protein n=1 Tax=Bimuria novae-zelandiae CBS 107.79 TaxID=1447943 RepID=A0A6A5VFM5_9PLEO|nr:hypothetical protein BU23DRAFT_555323 [Bimuria novae-zelandiae CBS 107.79]
MYGMPAISSGRLPSTLISKGFRVSGTTQRPLRKNRFASFSCLLSAAFVCLLSSCLPQVRSFSR